METVSVPSARRPINRPARSPLAWAKANLFSTPFNSVLTIVVGAALLAAMWAAVSWIIDIDFTIIRDTLRIFMMGSFPDAELWRLWVQGYLLTAAIGFASGALARNAYERALSQGLHPPRSRLSTLFRRFWPIIACLVFFASFARTWSPMILVVTAVASASLFRIAGWKAPAVLRRRAGYLAALAVVASMLVVAGTSRFGGFCIGLVLAVWVFAEIGRRVSVSTPLTTVVRLVASVGVLVVAWLVIGSIDFTGYGWKQWGGFQVSLFAATIGIAIGLPLGILLALARRSRLPVVKTAAVLFIEFVRGVPLLSLLIFSIVLLPLFLPPSWETPAALTSAFIVIGLFSAAYIAEIVRGGLQAVPSGQTEAAQALGLTPGAMQRLIILPQALRAVIPAMVGQFISLFKDTSLLFAAGVLEFLGGTTIANNQPQFLGKGLAPVTYLFCAAGYWAFSYTMSRESRRLERRLSTSR